MVSALEEAAARAESRAGHLAAAHASERAAELSADPTDRGRRLVAAAEAAPAQALELLMSASRAGVEAGVVSAIGEVALLADAVSVEAGDEPSLFMQRLLSAQGAMWRGDTERGADLLALAIGWAVTIADPRHLSWASRAALFLGDHARAATLLDRAAAAARDRGAIGVHATVLGLRPMQLERANRYDDAVVAATEALGIARELAAPNFVPLPRAVLATVAAIRGRDADVRDHVEEASEVALAHGLAVPTAMAVWTQAMLDLGRGRWEHAFQGLTALTNVRPGFGTPVIAIVSAPDRVEAAARAGRIAEARAALAPFEAWAAHTGTQWARPSVALCRALVASEDTATSRFEHAIRDSGDARPFDSARARLLYGEHLRGQRRRGDPRTELRAALDEFDALGATPWADRARTELRATGETAHKRNRRRAVPAHPAGSPGRTSGG